MTTPAADDEATMHVVRSDETLDPAWVIDEVTESLSSIGTWITEAQENERTALALWDGQSADGRKWAANYGKKVFPHDGCPDSRVHLTGQAIDELTMLEMLAADSAKVQVIAMEAGDAAASKKVETLMKYETRQRLRDELWRERNFAKQIKHTFGHAVMGVDWEEGYGTARAKMSVNDLVRMETERALAFARESALAAQGAGGMGMGAGGEMPEAEDVLTPEIKMQIAEAAVVAVDDQLASEDLAPVVAMIRLAHPLLSPRRAKKVAREIAQRGSAEFAAPYRKPGRPTVRAYWPGIDIFYPWWTCPVKRAPWVAEVVRFSDPEIRAKPKTDNWNPKAVDALIALGPQQVIDTGVVMQAISGTTERMFNEPARLTFAQRLASKQDLAYEVLRITVNTVDEDGYPAVQEIILHPGLCGKSKRDSGDELVLKNELVDYYFEGGRFVDMRREFKSRPLFESRGVPEVAGTHQWLLKSTRDAAMTRTAFATMPIVKVNSRRAGEAKRWDYEPGSKLPLSSGDDAEYMQPPRLDQGSILDAEEIRRDAANLLGLHHEAVPQPKTLMHQQWLATNCLLEEREVLLRILAMDQQYMSPLYVSRVVGNGPLPFQITREEIAGSFDFVLEFDVKSLDMEYLEKRWSALKDAFSIPGVAGQVPTVPVVSWLLNNIDPTLADMVVGGLSERNAAEAEMEKNAISTMLTGIEPAVTESMDAATRLQAMQEQLKINPIVAQAYAQNPMFNEMMNARMAAFQHQITQKTENAQTGRTGFKPVIEAAV